MQRATDFKGNRAISVRQWGTYSRAVISSLCRLHIYSLPPMISGFSQHLLFQKNVVMLYPSPGKENIEIELYDF